MAFSFQITKFIRTEEGGIIVQLDDGMEYNWPTVQNMQDQIDQLEQIFRDERLPLLLTLLAYWHERDDDYSNFQIIANKAAFVDITNNAVIGVQ